MILSTCKGCGTRYTHKTWSELPYVGENAFPDPPVRLELRNCTCTPEHARGPSSAYTLAIWTQADGTPYDDQDAANKL